MSQKVLHIIDKMATGGAQRLVSVISNELGHPVYPLKETDTVFTFQAVNFTPGRFGFIAFYKLFSYIKKEQYSIIHCHLQKSYIVGLLMKFFLGKRAKLVFHEHGPVFTERGFYRLMSFFQRHVDGIVAVSMSTAHELEIRGLKPEKISVVKNFLDHQFFTDCDSEKNRKTSNEVILGFAARLSLVKGPDLFLTILSKLPDNYRGVMVGDGAAKKQVEQKIELLGLKNRVTLAGSTNSIVAYYCEMDVLIVPSRFESFGLSILEAQALGVPVVAADVGGVSENIIHKETGILFDLQNIDSVPGEIQNLIQDSRLYESISSKARISAREHTFESYAKELENFYQNV